MKIGFCRDKDDFRMLLVPCVILSAGDDNFPRTMRGWLRPTLASTSEFLEALSKNGATHHSTFVYGASVEEMEYFGRLLGLRTVIVG